MARIDTGGMNRVTENTYEATYYILHGASVENVRISTLNKAQARKKLFRELWTIHMTNVPEKCVELWQNGTAMVNVREFEARRKWLKKQVNKAKYT